MRDIPDFSEFLDSLDEKTIQDMVLAKDPNAFNLVRLPSVDSPDYSQSVELLVSKQNRLTSLRLMAALTLSRVAEGAALIMSFQSDKGT